MARRTADRDARRRRRQYTARRAVHVAQLARRRRDNIIAVTGALVVAAIAAATQVAWFTSGPGAPEPSPSSSASAAAEQNVGDVPSADVAQGRLWTGTLTLNDIPLAIEIDGAAAPQAASVFVSLAQEDYYVGNSCHRLTASASSSVIQCGQPDGRTTIDPGFSYGPLENVPVDGVYPAGTVAVARSESPYSQSTQFFITYEDSVLDQSTGGYSVVGRVTDGLDRFRSEIAGGGAVTAEGATTEDGSPAIPTTITALSVQ